MITVGSKSATNQESDFRDEAVDAALHNDEQYDGQQIVASNRLVFILCVR